MPDPSNETAEPPTRPRTVTNHDPRLLASLCAAFALVTGCVASDERLADGGALDLAAQAVTSSTRQFAGSYFNNVPLPDGRTSWSSVVVNNPNPTEATVTLTIRNNNGVTLATLTKEIAPGQSYNSYGQADWRAPASGSTGWVELASDVPVVATNQITLRSGTSYDSAVSLSNDEPFLKSPSNRLLSTFFLRNWPSGRLNVTQWTDIKISNPNTSAANVTVLVYKTNGVLHATVPVSVPKNGAWSSYESADLAWRNIPVTDSTLGGAMGWIKIESDQPVVASSQIAMRSGATWNASPVLLDNTAFEAQGSSTLRAPLFLKGAQAGGTITQWTTPVIVNPNDTTVTIKVVPHKNDGTPDPLPFTKDILARATWNAYDDPHWKAIALTHGWVEIATEPQPFSTERLPIFGVNRLMLRDGTTQSSPFTLFDDEPLAQATSSQQFASLYLKKWPSHGTYTQWTDLVVNNPSTTSPVTITVRLRKTHTSSDLTFFTRKVPARGSWRSWDDPQWLLLPESDPTNGRALAWIELTSLAPVTALSRTSLRNGSAATSTLTHFEDSLLQGNIGAACDPSGPAVFCPISTTSSPAQLVQQLKELVIVDPSVVNSGRADSQQNGHWSFRWLMEQMVTPGTDPSDFVETWLSAGFAGGTFNNFSLTLREAGQIVLNNWPRIPGTNKLDLARSPFVLLAIVNRVDLASGSGAGEGRFVFGVNLPTFSNAMTVNFEYKLPPSASRQVWAQRFHALGTLGFGDEYNARLQMITDEFTRRGADPSGVNGSSLGQLRTNERLSNMLNMSWQWREFQLIGGTPAKLQITTTKQTPHSSLNDSSRPELSTWLNQSSQAVLAGTAVVPSSLLGGESDEGPPWSRADVDPSVVNAFARQTCNGCHTGAGGDPKDAVIDGFLHISSMSPGGLDGTARLSPFMIEREVPRREVFMKATLCAGNCSATATPTTSSFVH